MKILRVRSRRVLLATAMFWIAGSLYPFPAFAADTEKKPNIILILSDTLRADYLGAYGFIGDVSPNLDGFARESVVFTHAVAAAPWTKPSVASLFTSLHPQTHRVVDHKGKFWGKVGDAYKTSALPGKAVTLAEILKKRGYRTAAWTANGWTTEKLGFAQGFDHFHSPRRDKNIYSGEEIWKPAWQWLLETKNDPRPFFLYLHFMDAHGPWRWNEADFLALRESPSLAANSSPHDLNFVSRPKIGRKIMAPAVDGSLRSWRAVYGAGVRGLDREIGELLQDLRSSGRMSDSVIVFTADHGEELMDHSGWAHGKSLYEHQIRVPLLIRPPGGADGRTVSRAVSLLDVMPTLLSAAGVSPLPRGMQGADLWQAVASNREMPTPGWAFSGGVKQNEKLVSIQDGRYKLIWDPRASGTASTLLFDLAQDPGEHENLAAKNEDLLNQLLDRLKRHVEVLMNTGTLLEADAPLTMEEIERLKSLGYVD